MVTRVDDNIASGEHFTVYGEGFDAVSEVFVSEITDACIPEAPPENAVQCSVLNRDPQALTVQLPETCSGGSYQLWASNQYGMSVTVGLNISRPQWVSDDTLAAGDIFSVYGKNLRAKEFGGTKKSGVSLLDAAGNAYDIPIINVNPYSIKCKLDAVPAGEYTVYVSNDGYIWNACADGRTVTVLDSVYDPYGLGAAFAHAYQFDNVVDLGEWPYLITDGQDITYTLQAAVNSVHDQGGGVVYIPKGRYYITDLTLKDGAVLAGAGQDQTVLSYLGGDVVVRGGNSSATGIVDLTIDVPEAVPLPDTIIQLGRGFDPTPVSSRRAEYAFLKRVSIQTKMTYDPARDQRGIGVLLGGKSHFLVDACSFQGCYATITSSYVGEYTKITNNTIHTAVGNIALIGEYAVIENNCVARDSTLVQRDVNTQGVFMRGFSYVAENQFMDVYNAEAANDGEIVCTENYQGGLKLSGTIAEAEAQRAVLNVTEALDWDLDDVYYAAPYLVITEGRGMGQYARITDFDPETATVELAKPFCVLPDSQSKFVVSTISENATIYRNYCENSEKGYWLYNDNIDCVVANNVGINTEGVYMRTIYKNGVDGAGKADIRETIGYFISMEDNDFVGGSVYSGVCGIGIEANIEGADPSMTYIYGVSMKDNTLQNKTASDAYETGWEAPHLNGIYVIYKVQAPQTAPHTAIRQVLIENNTVTDCDRGITIGPFGRPNYQSEVSYAAGDMTQNIYMGENQFENVERPLVDERAYVHN